jgi:hypothetical protein
MGETNESVHLNKTLLTKIGGRLDLADEKLSEL